MLNNLTIGKKVKKFRNKAGLSQIELESMLDASSGSLSRIESGEVNPTKEMLNKLNRGFKYF